MPRRPSARRQFNAFALAHRDEINGRIAGAVRSKGPLPTGLTIEDVQHEALCRLRRHWPQLANDGAEAAIRWAVRAAVNYAIDEFRIQQSRADVSWRQHVALAAPAPQTPEDAVLDALNRERLYAALPLLPKRQRAAVRLFYFEGKSRREAAAVIGVSETAVKGLLQRALATLRRHMEQAPGLVPLGRLLGRSRRPATATALATPSLLAAVVGLAYVTSLPPLLRVPHAQSLVVAAPTQQDMPHDRRGLPRGLAPVPPDGRAARADAPPGNRAGVGEAPAHERHGRKAPKPKLGVKLGDEDIGWAGGDRVCAESGTGQEPGPLCANQSAVGLCPLVDRAAHPNVRCERGSKPTLEPPPLP